MKLLVATTQTQGKRKSDFCWCAEDEIVKFPFECDSDRGKVDGHCGCLRSMSGLDTTMKVVDSEITEDTLKDRLRQDKIKNWSMTWDEATEDAELEAGELLRVAAAFDVGHIVEKRGRVFRERGLK